MGTQHVYQIEENALLAYAIMQPGQTQKVPIGLYEMAIPLPTLCFKTFPKSQKSIDATLIKQEQNDEYQLTCELRNNGTAACTVVIRECETGQKQPVTHAKPVLVF